MEKTIATDTIQKITAVFPQFPSIEKAVLFGSRALGNHRNNSDIDIALFGSALTFKDVALLEALVDDLGSPFKVDFCHYEQLDNPALREHIDQVGKRIYTRSTTALDNNTLLSTTPLPQ